MLEVTGEGNSACGLLVREAAGSVDVEVQGIHANRGGRIAVTDAPPSTGDAFQLENDCLPVQLPLQRAGQTRTTSALMRPSCCLVCSNGRPVARQISRRWIQVSRLWMTSMRYRMPSQPTAGWGVPNGLSSRKPWAQL